PRSSTLFPYTTLFRSIGFRARAHVDRPGRADHRFLILHHDMARRLALPHEVHDAVGFDIVELEVEVDLAAPLVDVRRHRVPHAADRKSTRLNSSHVKI